MSIDTIQFETLQDFSGVVNLLQVANNAARPMDRTLWKYQQNRGLLNLPHGVAAYSGGQLVGWAGFLYQPLNISGSLVDAIQVGDVAVHPDFQNQGVADLLANYFASHLGEYGDLAFGFTENSSLFSGVVTELTALSLYSAIAPEIPQQINNSSPSIRTDLNWSSLLAACNSLNSSQKTLESILDRYTDLSDRTYSAVTVFTGDTVIGFAVGRFTSPGEFLIYDVIADSSTAALDAISGLINLAGTLNTFSFWCSNGFPWQGEIQSAGLVLLSSCQMHAICVPLKAASPVNSLVGSLTWCFTQCDTDY